MSRGFNIECPKCHADRTQLDTSFGLPGYIDQRVKKDSGESISLTSALPVRVILCPRTVIIWICTTTLA